MKDRVRAFLHKMFGTAPDTLSDDMSGREVGKNMLSTTKEPMDPAAIEAVLDATRSRIAKLEGERARVATTTMGALSEEITRLQRQIAALEFARSSETARAQAQAREQREQEIGALTRELVHAFEETEATRDRLLASLIERELAVSVEDLTALRQVGRDAAELSHALFDVTGERSYARCPDPLEQFVKRRREQLTAVERHVSMVRRPGGAKPPRVPHPWDNALQRLRTVLAEPVESV